METFGGFGSRSSALLRILADASSTGSFGHRATRSSRGFLRHVHNSTNIAVTIALANANLQLDGLHNMRVRQQKSLRPFSRVSDMAQRLAGHARPRNTNRLDFESIGAQIGLADIADAEAAVAAEKQAAAAAAAADAISTHNHAFVDSLFTDYEPPASMFAGPPCPSPLTPIPQYDFDDCTGIAASAVVACAAVECAVTPMAA